MSQVHVHVTRRRLRTPGAAALAGILFAVFLSIGQTLILLASPSDIPEIEWFAKNVNTISSGIGLITFAALCFLWFMGVVRDRIGHEEDQFFSTVFLGSGLLYLALKLASAGIALGLIEAFKEVGSVGGDDTILFALRHMVSLTDDLATRLSAAFMMSLATIALQTQVFRRWLVFATYGFALVLLLIGSVNGWFTLIFPTWVFVISVDVLVQNRRRSKETASNQVPPVVP